MPNHLTYLDFRHFFDTASGHDSTFRAQIEVVNIAFLYLRFVSKCSVTWGTTGYEGMPNSSVLLLIINRKVKQHK